MTPMQIVTALAAAWQSALGAPAPRSSLLLLAAQVCFETGNGRASENWNLGGIKHVPGDGHDYAEYLTHEVVGGVDTVIPQHFRAYKTLDEAAFDYLRTLRRDFLFAWPALYAGDIEDFAHRLHVRGYFTADEHTYAKGLRARYDMLDALVAKDADTALADGRPAYVLPDPGSTDPSDLPPAVA